MHRQNETARILFFLVALLASTTIAGNPVKKGMGFVGQLVFGPTIDDAEDAGYRVVAHGAARIDQLIVQADRIARERTVDLQDAISEEMNVSFREAEKTLNESWENVRSTGALYTFLADKTLERLGWILRSSIYVLVFAALFIAAVIFVMLLVRDHGRRKRHSAPTLIGLLAVFIIAVALSFLVSHNDSRCRGAERLAQTEKESYASAYAEMRFTRARYHAYGLEHWARDCAPKERRIWNLREQKAELLERVFRKPGSYADRTRLITTVGDLEFFLRLKNLEDQPSDASDIYTALALVEWVANSDRRHEFKAAKAAALALRPFVEPVEADWREEAPLLPLAVHYLSLYLSRPLSEEELEIRDVNQADIDLSRTFALTHAAGAKLISSGTYGSVARFRPYIDYGVWRSEFLRSVVPLYVCLVDANSLAEITFGTPASDTHLTRRDSCAKSIMDLYDGPDEPSGRPRFVRELVLVDAYSGTSIRRSALLGPHAIYERAKTYYEYPIRGSTVPGQRIRIPGVGRIVLPPGPPPIQPIAAPRDLKVSLEESPAARLIEGLPETDLGAFAKRKAKEALQEGLPQDISELMAFETAYLDYRRAVHELDEMGRLIWGSAYRFVRVVPPPPGSMGDQQPGAERWRQKHGVVVAKRDAAALAAGSLGLFLCRDSTEVAACPAVADSQEPIPVPLWLESQVPVSPPTLDMRKALFRSAETRLWRVP